MNKSKNKSEDAQGAETESVTVNDQIVDQGKVKKWLKEDISRCISLFHALHSDPDLLDTLANFMYGRLLNDQARKKAEPELSFSNGK